MLQRRITTGLTALLWGVVTTMLVLLVVTMVVGWVAAAPFLWGESSVPFVFAACFLLGLTPMFLVLIRFLDYLLDANAGRVPRSRFKLLMPPIQGLVYVILAGGCFAGYLQLTGLSLATLDTYSAMAVGGVLALALVEVTLLVVSTSLLFLPLQPAGYHLV